MSQSNIAPPAEVVSVRGSILRVGRHALRREAGFEICTGHQATRSSRPTWWDVKQGAVSGPSCRVSDSLNRPAGTPARLGAEIRDRSGSAYRNGESSSADSVERRSFQGIARLASFRPSCSSFTSGSTTTSFGTSALVRRQVTVSPGPTWTVCIDPGLRVSSADFASSGPASSGSGFSAAVPAASPP